MNEKQLTCDIHHGIRHPLSRLYLYGFTDIEGMIRNGIKEQLGYKLLALQIVVMQLGTYQYPFEAQFPQYLDIRCLKIKRIPHLSPPINQILINVSTNIPERVKYYIQLYLDKIFGDDRMLPNHPDHQDCQEYFITHKFDGTRECMITELLHDMMICDFGIEYAEFDKNGDEIEKLTRFRAVQEERLNNREHWD